MDRADKIGGTGEPFIGGKQPVQEIIGLGKRAPARAHEHRGGSNGRVGILAGAPGQPQGHARQTFQAANGFRLKGCGRQVDIDTTGNMVARE